jgi:hypothetical protein
MFGGHIFTSSHAAVDFLASSWRSQVAQELSDFILEGDLRGTPKSAFILAPKPSLLAVGTEAVEPGINRPLHKAALAQKRHFCLDGANGCGVDEAFDAALR